MTLCEATCQRWIRLPKRPIVRGFDIVYVISLGKLKTKSWTASGLERFNAHVMSVTASCIFNYIWVSDFICVRSVFSSFVILFETACINSHQQHYYHFIYIDNLQLLLSQRNIFWCNTIISTILVGATQYNYCPFLLTGETYLANFEKEVISPNLITNSDSPYNHSKWIAGIQNITTSQRVVLTYISS